MGGLIFDQAGGATIDVGAPEKQDYCPQGTCPDAPGNDIYPGIWTRGHRPPQKKYTTIIKYCKPLALRYFSHMTIELSNGRTTHLYASELH